MKIVITGSSRGIGRYLTFHLLEQGHEVWGLARTPQDELAQKWPGRFHFTACDVSDWNALEAARKALVKKWPALDGLVGCAGAHGPVGPAMSLDPAAWADSVQAGMAAAFFPIRAFYAQLQKAQRRGKVVLFSGGGATAARANFSAYAAVKSGVVRLAETLSQEWAHEPLDVNAVAPGAIHTDLTQEILKLGAAKVGQKEFEAAMKVAAGGGGSLEKVAGLIDFLLSEASDQVSGKLFAAQWDDWTKIRELSNAKPDLFTLRRIA